MVGVAALVVLSYLGTPIAVPDWLRMRITDRINESAGAVQVELGDMVVVIERGWNPRLELRNVEFRNLEGTSIATLSELGGTVAMRPLLRGKVQPGTLRLSGAAVTFRRNKDGEVNAALGHRGPSPDAQNRELAALVDLIDDALQQPALAALTRVDADNLIVLYEDARAGRAWTVDGGRLELTREGRDLRLRGDFALLGARAYVTTLEMNYASRIGEAAADFGVSFEDMPAGDIAGQSPALAWLGALDAPISGALRVSVDESGGLGPLNATLQIGAGVLQPTEATKPIAFSSARSYFTYDPKTQAMQFDEVTVDSKWGSVRAEGKAFLAGVEGGLPGELQAQMRLSNISANPDNFYAEPVRIDAATVDMRLVFEPFQLSIGEMSLADQGRQLVLSGEFKAVEAGWDLALDGLMNGLDYDRLMQLWPASIKENTRNWINKNVTEGVLRNIQLAVRSKPESKPDVYLGFDFEGLKTTYVNGLPPIEGAAGQAVLFEKEFVIRADKGYVQAAQGGRIDVAGTSFVVEDTTIKISPAVANLRTDSTITAALALLDAGPLKFLTKIDRPVTLADGRARLKVRLDLPLKKQLTTAEVGFDVSGQLSDVRSETLVPGRLLAASELNVLADNETLQISGDGRLGLVPFRGQWRSALGKGADGTSRVVGQVELSERFVDEFRIGLPPGSLSGAAQGDITLDLKKDASGTFELASDLQGLGMRLQQLDWSKAAAARGSLKVAGRIGEPPAIDRLSMAAPGLTAEGSVSLRADGQLERAVFSKVLVGNWLDAPVELLGRGAGAVPAVRVNGGTVDLRQTSLSSGADAAKKQGGPVSLKLDRLTISEGIVLTGFLADLNTSNGTSGTFAGRVNGGAAITGTIIPQDGRSAFRILSQDAGGVMGSAGLLKQARGGDMELVLVPSQEAGTYNGRLQAQQVWLTDAPAMAALLSTLSVVGLLEQLSGNGILFGNVDAQFTLSPDTLTLYKSSAVGTSMGITMDGYYWLANGVMDMQGVISPLYLVNGIGGLLTRKGEGLVGFNYKLEGQASDPRVKILPLTIFTPGMFREIFRRSPPGSKSRAAEDTDTQPSQTQRRP